MDDGCVFQCLKLIPVHCGGEQVELVVLRDAHLVQVPPCLDWFAHGASDLLHLLQVLVEVHVVLLDVLVRVPSELLVETLEHMSNFEDALFQVS